MASKHGRMGREWRERDSEERERERERILLTIK